MLLCPVRDCHLPLAREGKRLVCARGHSFDISSTGYVNLLQPQDRQSKQPGDTADAVKGVKYAGAGRSRLWRGKNVVVVRRSVQRFQVRISVMVSGDFTRW